MAKKVQLKRCEHRFHLVRVRPEIIWGSLGADKYLAIFVCEHCGYMKQIRLKEYED